MNINICVCVCVYIYIYTHKYTHVSILFQILFPFRLNLKREHLSKF